jgi:hypothetical protein
MEMNLSIMPSGTIMKCFSRDYLPAGLEPPGDLSGGSRNFEGWVHDGFVVIKVILRGFLAVFSWDHG